MREQKYLYILLGYLSCAMAYVQQKNCGDCTRFYSCNAATVLLNQKAASANAKLQAAFCGFDNGGLPKVCCSELSDNCGDCTRFYSCKAATVLFNQNATSANAKLQAAFCGFDNGGLPKVCCSELSTVQSTSSDFESVEGHPNLSLLPESCGDIQEDMLVGVGGNAARLYEFPWMVLLSFKTMRGLQFQCGGSLINDRYVLTAAHCVVNQQLAGVRVGEHDIDTAEDCEGEPPNQTCETKLQDIRIERTIPHPRYSGKPRVRNDIALLRLKKPVVFADNARTICLPVTSAMQSRDVSGLNARVTGWGITETHYPSSKLVVVDVPVHSQSLCSEIYNRGNQVGSEDETANKLCAGTTGRDSCGGDSGGPLMVIGPYNNSSWPRYIQHGIVSYGPKQCGSKFPGVYTDVTKYMKWILDNIAP